MGKVKKFQLKKAKAPKKDTSKKKEVIEEVIVEESGKNVKSTRMKKEWESLNSAKVKEYQNIIEQAQLYTLHKSKKTDTINPVLLNLATKLKYRISKLKAPTERNDKSTSKKDVNALEIALVKELQSLTILRKSILSEETRVEELSEALKRIKSKLSILEKENQNIKEKSLNPLLLEDSDNKSMENVAAHPLTSDLKTDLNVSDTLGNVIIDLSKTLDGLNHITSPLHAVIDQVKIRIEALLKNQ